MEMTICIPERVRLRFQHSLSRRRTSGARDALVDLHAMAVKRRHPLGMPPLLRFPLS